MLDQPEQVRELIHYVEVIHHPLEEEQLFPFLEQQECLHQGGPRCSYFMGLRLDCDPLKLIREHLDDFFLATKFSAKTYPLPSWLKPQSPLSIPIEEHVVGAELAQSLLYILDNPEMSLKDKYFSKLYYDYCRLLKMHIDKEDNCLFIMCRRALV